MSSLKNRIKASWQKFTGQPSNTTIKYTRHISAFVNNPAFVLEDGEVPLRMVGYGIDNGHFVNTVKSPYAKWQSSTRKIRGKVLDYEGEGIVIHGIFNAENNELIVKSESFKVGYITVEVELDKPSILRS